MITMYNDKMSEDMQEKYRSLLNRAYNDLKEKGKITDADGEVFTDLAQYYAHMLDFIEIGKPVYLLLPLDEGHFKINANTRKIDVPKEFKECGGVTNDNLCEIATFTIDRYFDYVDLANPKVKIMVEWRNAAGKQGLTNINLIDLDTFFADGLIRFGWPITKDITEADGTVTFAVKFFMRNAEEKMTHVLNTLPETIVIKKGLSIDQPDVEIDATSDLFTDIVVNNVGNVANLPSLVQFVDFSWSESDTTPLSDRINENDELVLTARAHTADFNEMNYTWYRSEWAEDNSSFKDDIIPVVSDDYYEVSTDYIKYEKTENERFPFRKFYKQITIPGEEEGDEPTISYVAYTGIDWPEEDLYSQITTLKFKKLTETMENKDITGKYYVKATNQKDIEGNLISTGTTPPCVLFKPDKITYTTKLPESITLDKNKNEKTLKVEFKASDKNPILTHTWSGKDGDGQPIEINSNKIENTKTSSSYTTATPGFYSVSTLSTLNRYEESVDSISTCKIVESIQPPTIEACYCNYTANNSYDKDETSLLSWIDNADKEDSGAITWSNFSGSPYIINNKINYADIFFLRIDHDLLDEIDKDVSLKTDKITYEWYYQQNDSDKVIKITNDLVGENNLVPTAWGDHLNSNSIALRCIWNDGEAYTFKCKIINSLGNQQDAEIVSQQIIIYNTLDADTIE